ncbi:Flp pilus assembly protein TadD [Sinimarinibacterium thermocellulolyticum]|uniref:Flp pilus assembly protein TadD n=1 Tax=Sinimarinibacterium thermocellulolyticum TaxID=3170016 RepID=A0ABV2A621_9GAMM
MPRRLWLAAPLALVLMLAQTSGCAAPRRLDAPANPPRERDAQSVDREVYTDLIRSMLDQKQYYAALAHVEQRRVAGGGDRDELNYLEAEARRGLGQIAAADALYQSLLRSPLAAQAYHGLGLLHARTEPARSIAFLREAARLRPTDADVRNDLGYALLTARRHREALHELATAVELAPESTTARNNLLLLMMVQGDEAAVSRIAREAAVPPETISRLRERARILSATPTASGGRG